MKQSLFLTHLRNINNIFPPPPPSPFSSHLTPFHSLDTPSSLINLSYIGTKEWLRGFYFQDESIMAHELTNAQLAAILDPTSDSYRDLIGKSSSGIKKHLHVVLYHRSYQSYQYLVFDQHITTHILWSLM